MPKTFTDQEKEIIREALVTKGREFFSTYGLKKTSVEDLTRAVGIAQGSFYKFFGSKEELYFEILEREQSVSHQWAAEILASGKPAGEALKELIKSGFSLMDTSPVLRRFYEERTYEVLFRKLPPQKVAKHQEEDAKLMMTLLTRWQKSGQLAVEARPEIIAGLFRSLFLLSLHRQEIGPDIYPEVVNLLAEILAKGLTKEGVHHD